MAAQFGDIIFEVQAGPRRLSETHSARLARHDVAGAKPIVELVGYDATRVELTWRLLPLFDPFFVDVEAVYASLVAVIGEAHPLFVGPRYLGTFVLERLQRGQRRALAFDVNVTLVEYDQQARL